MLDGGLVLAGSLTESEQLAAQRQARHDAPEAFLAREESRVKYEGLDPGQAAGVAKSAFPGLIDRPAGGAPDLFQDERVTGYLTDHAAEVALPGGQKGIVESLAPIAVSSGRGHLPIELRLQEAGGGFTPVRSDLSLGIPKRLQEGVSLAKLGVSLTPIAVNGAPLPASEGTLDGAAAVWRLEGGGAGGEQDLESVAKATSDGFDLTSLLLSERSPGTLYFHVGTPAGTRLVQNRDGSIGLLAGGKPLATIAPVSAQDAEGNSVPISTALHGDMLEVSLDLQGEYRYPIAVDPEVNDGQLVKAGEKRSNWEFHTANGSAFQGNAVYEGAGKEHLETRAISSYGAGQVAYWAYQTQGKSKIYELKAETEARNKGSKIESFLELEAHGTGSQESKETLSNEAESPEYSRRAAEPICPKNGEGKQECLPTAGGEGNAARFQQSATGSGSSFSDTLYQGIVSISELSEIHSTTGYNESLSSVEVEAENAKGEKEKVKRTNALEAGKHTWLAKLLGAAGGAIELEAHDVGIGVSATKLEYENTPGTWVSLEEHNYLAENGCQGVQCYPSHSEGWTLTPTLPDGEDNLRYRAEEAMSGTQSLSTEGVTAVKVDTKKPHGLKINGLPYDGELSERPYELTVQASDGEGSTVPSSGVKSIELYVDGTEFGEAGGSCTAAKGECTASHKWTVNGAELGAGKHGLEVVVFDNAGNEARYHEDVAIRHSTPVALGPGSVDLQSGDFSLGATDVSQGSGLTVSRNYSSRATTEGDSGPLGPEWSLSLGSSESLTELPDKDMMLTAANGAQTIFASLGEGKFESPPGDSNLELQFEENKAKEPIAYYLKNASDHTSIKFTKQSGTEAWLPTKQEGTVATDTLAYTYEQIPSQTQYKLGTESWPREIIAGPDGNLWFTNNPPYGGHPRIGRISPTGDLVEFPIKYEAEGLTVGHEGNVWFAGGAGIGRITPTGAITEYTLPGSSSPTGIAMGSDGNLWVTNYFGNEIEMVTPKGAVTGAYSLPVGSSPYKITAGPDGNIWFTEPGSSKIGRITTSGSITQYSLGAAPISITAGPDGNLWFTEKEAKKIGKITPAGSVTTYSVSETLSPWGIAVGPDKKLWFTADSETNHEIGSITTSGVVGPMYGVNTKAWSIAAGSDGKLWYPTEHGIETTTTTHTIVVPKEVQAPVPAGISCSPEAKPGCRSLTFSYEGGGVATGEGPSEWGEYPDKLRSVSLHAYNNSTSKMESTKIAEYAYDIRGRLRAEWDPRISPTLKTTYGYDEKGHVTAVNPPGQEPWTFTYGAIAGDAGTGRLLKASRTSASTALWTGELLKSTEAPKITGTTHEGTRLAVSNGAWSGSPVSFGYQWERCTYSNECSTIPGATNANYTLGSGDVADTVRVAVTAVNGGGSVTVMSAATSPVWYVGSAEYTAPGGLAWITAGPEAETFWFTDYSNSVEKISEITTEGAITEYSVSGQDPDGLTSGPDGDLWFTRRGTSKIGKMTTGGSVTEYALPANSEPTGIVKGPDGKLWFTDSGSGKIGKITTEGAITEYALAKGVSPHYITVGPDGNLWFTAGSKVGKITTSGAVTEYTLAKIGADGITVGPDGNLWFVGSDTESNKICKMTTAGAITEYTMPWGSDPERIASAGGSLWVTSASANPSNRLYKVSTSGAVTTIGLPAGSSPKELAVSGEELWFVQSSKQIREIPTSSYGEGFSEGEAKSPQPGMTMEYNVPVAGTGAPHEMSEGAVAKWGQSDDPVEATAVFPMDSPQGWPTSSYARASVYYLDEHGRQVNVASPSTAAYGSISTTEYNEFNDVIRTLTPDNREAALKSGPSSTEVSKELDTQSTYNGEGAKEGEVEEPGTRLLEVLGPQHEIQYRAGGEVKERLARNHEELFYDQGAPGGENYDLVTEKTDVAKLSAPYHEEVDERTTRMSYSGQSDLGWELRAPTSVTVDPGGAKLTTTTEYDKTTGEVTEVRGAGVEATFSYASKFGETGSEAGKLKDPWGVAVNSEGKLWVVDSANNRVEEFSSTGSYSGAKFGETGSGTGQLKEPEGVALDSSGHIWVADTGNNRLEEFSSSGAYMATVGSLGTETGKLKAPAGLAFDAKGNLWVADTGNNRVEKFSKEGECASKVGTPECVSKFGAAGSEPGQLAEPKGIVVDSGEHVWVADTGNNRIQEFSITGSPLKHFGSAGTGEGQLKAPVDLKIDSAGDVWTVDSLNDRAEAFTPSGGYVTQVGWKGTEAGQLSEPRALAFDASGKLWVADGADNRMEQWSKGANAHDQKTVYYAPATNSEYSACGEHPEWAGLVCETLPVKQPELMGLPKLPVTTYTYNMYDEPETIVETFGSTTRTKKETYDEAGRRTSSETTATTGVSLPKVTFSYDSTLGVLEKETTAGEGKTLTSSYNRVGQLTKYTDSDGNVTELDYGGPAYDYLLEAVVDSSDEGTSEQDYAYDGTTMLRTGLWDSAAGELKASYDAEGKLTSVVYPHGICANYSHNSVGEAVGVHYLKTPTHEGMSECPGSAESEWYGQTRVPSIHGETLSQTSTLGNESYAYNTAGQLTETQETPTGEGCKVRAYAYDEEDDRASLTSRTPGTGGACQSEGGTVEAHNYDEADRLADTGIAYNALGDITKLPAADAEGHELTSTFYVDNAVASQTQSGVTNEYKLDPEGRVRETTTGSTKTISHYDGPGEAVAWTESPEKWVRNIYGLEGALLATQTNGETPILQLHDLQGNVVATIGDKAGETKLLSTYNSTEFGVPTAGKAPPKLAWAGALGVESSFSTGIITYGATSYVPQAGRSLQSEQVEAPGLGGGSGRGAAYTMQEEPWVMQGALRAGAESVALEAARERAAAEAALRAAAAAGGEDPTTYMSQEAALALGERLNKADNWSEVWDAVFGILGIVDPVAWVEGAVVGVFSLDVMQEWLHNTGGKLEQCGKNTEHWVIGCELKYDTLLGGRFIDPLDTSEVEKCGTYIWYKKFLAHEAWECRRLKESPGPV